MAVSTDSSLHALFLLSYQQERHVPLVAMQLLAHLHAHPAQLEYSPLGLLRVHPFLHVVSAVLATQARLLAQAH